MMTLLFKTWQQEFFTNIPNRVEGFFLTNKLGGFRRARRVYQALAATLVVSDKRRSKAHANPRGFLAEKQFPDAHACPPLHAPGSGMTAFVPTEELGPMPTKGSRLSTAASRAAGNLSYLDFKQPANFWNQK